MNAGQLIRLLEAVPQDSLVVFGGDCVTVKTQDNLAFKSPLKKVVVGTEVIPILYVAHAEVDDVSVVCLSFNDPQGEDEEPNKAESYWTV